MSNTFFLVFFGFATLFFGYQTLRILPTAMRLLRALLSGVVNWPGPRIHDPSASARKLRGTLGTGYQHLFSTFLWNSLVVMAAWLFSVLSFISRTSLMSDSILYTGNVWLLICLSLVALAGGVISANRALGDATKVKMVLGDRERTGEPKSVDGHSAEAAYAIEHPLVGHKILKGDHKRAIDQFYESVKCHQDGNDYRATMLYREAMRTDPSLHEHARTALAEMSQEDTAENEGAIYYWLGIHSEHLRDWKQAAVYYSRAISAFRKIGYPKRESRCHCNLGSTKMRLGDPTGMEEFETAVKLDPGNGTAHINIGRAYYRIGHPGDAQYERALDAFADAIVADPQTYGPIVIASLQQIGYTWKEDLEEVTHRVEKKQRTAGSR
jgi:hypothetical protein